jgi:3-oxo-5-alpha-steroid 4-dehydrogenase 1
MFTLDDEFKLYSTIEYSMIFMSFPTFLALLYIDSPFGKHSPENGNDSKQWWMGPMLPARPSWFFFEIPNVIWTVVCWMQRNKQIFHLENSILVALFFIHYLNRSIIYPIRMKKSKPMPTVVVFSALSFCMFNG